MKRLTADELHKKSMQNPEYRRAYKADALTHDFKETVRSRAQAEPAFRRALLGAALKCVFREDFRTVAIFLRDYLKARPNAQACAPGETAKMVISKTVTKNPISFKL
jgi:hypothetical protein